MLGQVILWLALLVILFGIEMATMGLTTIWFAGGALVAIIAAVLHVPFLVQVVLFFLVSLLMLIFTRPIAVKYFNKDRIKTNVESIVGKQAIVTEDIHNLLEKGKVTVNGMEWTARNVVADESIKAGAIVTIESVSGVKLMVKESGKA